MRTFQSVIFFSVFIAFINFANAEDFSFCSNVVIDENGIASPDCDCDNIADKKDNCPTVKNGNCDAEPTICGGTFCEDESFGFQLDSNRDGEGDACDPTDTDLDLVRDVLDNCPTVPNFDQADGDDDGIGDFCEDEDFDRVYFVYDNCEETYNPLQMDADYDGWGDACDNCYLVPNENQFDFDDDGIGDACSGDYDGDGWIDDNDNCIRISNPDQNDLDGDNSGDLCDNCPLISNYEQEDLNNDGIGDMCEPLTGISQQPLLTTDLYAKGQFEQGSGGCSLLAKDSSHPLFIFILLFIPISIIAIRNSSIVVRR